VAAVAITATEGGEHVVTRMEDPLVWWQPESDRHVAYGMFQVAPGLQVVVGDLESAATLARGFDHLLRSWIAHERQRAMPEEVIDPEEAHDAVEEARQDMRDLRAMVSGGTEAA
jgi:hypothetical protein